LSLRLLLFSELIDSMKTIFVSNSRSFLDNDMLIVPVAVSSEKDAKSAWEALNAQSRKSISSLDTELNGLLTAKLKKRQSKLGAGSRTSFATSTQKNRKGSRELSVRISALKEISLRKPLEELDAWRKLGGDAARASDAEGCSRIGVYLEDVPHNALSLVLQAVVTGFILANYRYTEFKKTSRDKQTVRELLLCVTSKVKEGAALVKRAEALAAAVARTRDLVNAPPSHLPPRLLLKEAQDIARKSRGKIKLKSFNSAALKKLGAGALLGVARGSDEEPYLLHLTMRSKKKNAKKIVLVGKGITFDSGGLSIKPAKSMEDMKCDMAGAACCLHTLGAISQMGGSPHEIHVLVPTCENMVSAQSIKPGDVLRAINKKTIEVLNTDAEGRLILADALSYAEGLKPDIVVDVATLTGAIIVSLGDDYAGLFTDDDDLSRRILEEGKKSGERFWRMPLAENYRPLIEGSISDLKNISPGGGPGAIIAALFLKEFVPKNCRWAHLDIAGPAHVGKSHEYFPGGGSGFGVRTLVGLIENLPA
jgi:leucyl aminopeptidase